MTSPDPTQNPTIAEHLRTCRDALDAVRATQCIHGPSCYEPDCQAGEATT